MSTPSGSGSSAPGEFPRSSSDIWQGMAGDTNDPPMPEYQDTLAATIITHQNTTPGGVVMIMGFLGNALSPGAVKAAAAATKAAQAASNLMNTVKELNSGDQNVQNALATAETSMGQVSIAVRSAGGARPANLGGAAKGATTVVKEATKIVDAVRALNSTDANVTKALKAAEAAVKAAEQAAAAASAEADNMDANEADFRLFLTTRFDEYIEFQGKDVVAHIQLAGPQFPFGGVAIWFQANAPIRYVQRTSPEQVRASTMQAMPPQAAFLQGNITGASVPQVGFPPYIAWPGANWGQLGRWWLGPYQPGGSVAGCSTLPGCPI